MISFKREIEILFNFKVEYKHNSEMNHSLRLKSQARISAVALQLKMQSHSDDRYKKRWNSFQCD